MEKLVATASIKDAENCRSFVVFDTETTGLYPWRDKIIEVGAVRFRDGEPVETFHSMIDPEMYIPEIVTQINHITDDMVAGAPTAGEAMAAFDEFVGTDDIVGHNIDFDLRFIKSVIILIQKRLLKSGKYIKRPDQGQEIRQLLLSPE